MTVPRCAETTLAFFEILFQVVYREMVMNAVLKLENIWRHALMFCSVLHVRCFHIQYNAVSAHHVSW